ncbi:MAG: hypothetical protein AVDCRST_MAG48-3871, partial [uncultured Friedmanniella sp.]
DRRRPHHARRRHEGQVPRGPRGEEGAARGGPPRRRPAAGPRPRPRRGQAHLPPQDRL